MKAKELIKILESVSPDSEVTLGIGTPGDGGEQYRKSCAKAQLSIGECLDFLVIDHVIISNDETCYGGDDTMNAEIVLRQNNVCDLMQAEREFDIMYDEKPRED